MQPDAPKHSAMSIYCQIELRHLRLVRQTSAGVREFLKAAIEFVMHLEFPMRSRARVLGEESKSTSSWWATGVLSYGRYRCDGQHVSRPSFYVDSTLLPSNVIVSYLVGRTCPRLEVIQEGFR